MCHQLTNDRHHRRSGVFGASNGATPVPIGSAVRALFPKMLEHTHTLTDGPAN